MTNFFKELTKTTYADSPEEYARTYIRTEKEHWEREGFKEAWMEICDAATYYLNKDDFDSLRILERCRMSMEFGGIPVSKAIARKGRKLLSEYRLNS